MFTFSSLPLFFQSPYSVKPAPRFGAAPPYAGSGIAQDEFIKPKFGTSTNGRLTEEYINKIKANIRPATLADVDEMAQFIVGITGDDVNARKEILRKTIQHPDGIMYIARDRMGKLVMTAGVSPAECFTGIPSKTAVIVNFYLVKRLRGYGIASEFNRLREEFSKEHGFDRVVGYSANHRFADYYVRDRNYREGWSSCEENDRLKEKIQSLYAPHHVAMFRYFEKDL